MAEPTCESCHNQMYEVMVEGEDEIDHYYCIDCATEILGRAPDEEDIMPPPLELVRGGTYANNEDDVVIEGDEGEVIDEDFDETLNDNEANEWIDEAVEAEGDLDLGPSPDDIIAEWVEVIRDDPMYRDDPDSFRNDYDTLVEQWEDEGLNTQERIDTLREWLDDLEEFEEGGMERYEAVAQQHLASIRNHPVYRDNSDGFRLDYEDMQGQWEEMDLSNEQRTEMLRGWLEALSNSEAE